MPLPIEDVKQAGTEVKAQHEVEDELLHMLSQQAYTTKEVADYLGITQQGATHKLNKLVKDGHVIKRKAVGVNHYYVETE